MGTTAGLRSANALCCVSLCRSPLCRVSLVLSSSVLGFQFPPAVAALLVAIMSQHACDPNDELCATPTLPSLLVALSCEQPLCSFQAARIIAKSVYSEYPLTDASCDWILASIVSQLLPATSPSETPPTSSASTTHSTLSRRGSGAVQILAQLMRLCIRSSSALQDQSSSTTQQRATALWYIGLVPPFLGTVCSACLPATVSRDGIVEGELLSWLLDFAHALLDQPQGGERHTAISAFVDNVGQHVEAMLALPEALVETAILLLTALSQMALLLPADAVRSSKHYRILQYALQRPQQSAHIDASDDGHASNEHRSLWPLLSCSLRLCASSLSAAQRESVLASLSIFVRTTGANDAESLVELLSEDDEQLVDTLMQLAHAVPALRGDGDAPVLSALDPFALFFAFLRALSFDSSVVLDYLISTETRCLEYLMVVLKMAETRAGFRRMKECCHAATGDAAAEPGIDSALACLIRLRLSIQRLVDKVRGTLAHGCRFVE